MDLHIGDVSWTLHVTGILGKVSQHIFTTWIAVKNPSPSIKTHQLLLQQKLLNESSWWFQPIWKICSSNWIISPGRDLSCHHLVMIQYYTPSEGNRNLPSTHVPPALFLAPVPMQVHRQSLTACQGPGKKKRTSSKSSFLRGYVNCWGV